VLDKCGLDNPNKSLGILRACHNGKLFTKGSPWNAEIVDCLKPKISDFVIQNKTGLDGFVGTELQQQLERRGIETIIVGGFLTNCCVESTMRTGYEKGYNVITLSDGSACTSH
jgi:nicotinamidase-related amidase